MLGAKPFGLYVLYLLKNVLSLFMPPLTFKHLCKNLHAYWPPSG